jgi:integrase
MIARRARRGRGTVFWDATRGCYVGQLSLGRDPQTGRHKRSPKVYAATEDECRDLLDGLRAELKQTGTVAAKDATVEMVLADLLASPPAEWASPLTLRGNADRIARIIAALGSTKLQRLTVGQVERMLRDMAAAGSSSDNIRRARALLARAIRRAQRDGLVHRNVAELAEVPRGTKRPSKAMTLDQMRALLAADLTPWWRAYIVTALTCGLRPGEMLGLRWQYMDLRDATIRVRMCLKVLPGADGKRVVTLADLKTDRSRRTMALPRDAATALRALKAQQAKDRLRLGDDWTDSGLVFADGHGGPRWPQDVRKQFGRLCERAGLGAGWHPHETRHTWVSILSDAGVDIEDIADAACHITSAVTRNVYRHQIADKLTKASAAMDAIFNPAEVSGS